ncbi:MAG: hypothetical protein IJ609_03685 [Paludibacteraceae bacterium]|nr:hypothetical protein [Paludibacteraceae bacterium]
MKKIFSIMAAGLVALSASAYTINNPIGEDGRYIVKYDCAKGEFAASNDVEMDEAFTLAVDITGTWLEDYVKGTPKVAGATRGVALNHWTSVGATNGDVRRLKQINGNIYGMTVCYAQVAADGEDYSPAKVEGEILYVMGQLFGFEFTADNAGADWWAWEGNEVAETVAPNSPDGNMFALAPYTGTKASSEFYGDDFSEDMFGMALKGYAAPCVLSDATAIPNVSAEGKAVKVLEDGQLIIKHNGVRYNALGTAIR